jgi:biotin synthase-like enzyme
MNKARRHELKMLHYKRRKRNKFRGQDVPDIYLFALRSHGCPCSCYACQQPEDSYNRAKEKQALRKELSLLVFRY